MIEERMACLDEAYAAWNRRDFDAWAEQFAEDVVYDPSDSFLDQQPMHGRAELRAWIEYIFRAWEWMTIEPLETIEQSPDRIVQRIRIAARGTTTGLSVEQELYQSFGYSGGIKPDRAWLSRDRPG